WPGLFRPHCAQCSRLSPAAGPGGTFKAAGLPLAYGPEGDSRGIARIRAAGGGNRRQGSLSAATCLLRPIGDRQSTAGSGVVRAPDTRRGRLSQASRGSGALAWHHLQRVWRGVRAWPEPEKSRRGLALVALPAALVADVFHGQWPGAALLYRAVFAARLRQLHFGQCDAANLAGHLERARVSGLSQGPAARCAAGGLRQLRTALEPVSDIARKSDAPRPDVHRQAVVSAVIPCLDEEEGIAGVVSAVLAQNVSEVVVVDGGSRDGTVDRATAAGACVIVEARRGYGRAIQA